MTKKILTIALAVLAVCGFNAAAQQRVNPQSAQAGDNNKMYQPQTFQDFAFEGILLDISQQARVDSLNAAFKANREAQMHARKDARKEAKEAKQNKGKDCKMKDCKDKAQCQAQAQCDTAKCDKAKCDKAKCDKVQGGKCKKGMRAAGLNSKQDYILAVKEILTPEQYTTFLENIVFMPDQHQKAPRMDQGCNKQMRDHKDAVKGDKRKADKKR